jgi:hypothetical protein
MISSNRWIKLIAALLLGIALGMVYGWVIAPIQYTDVPPNILREDYRADYVLMVAEANQTQPNSATAARRLAMLDSVAPAQIVSTTLRYATDHGFTQNEILVLQNLLSAMQTYQPQGSSAP